MSVLEKESQGLIYPIPRKPDSVAYVDPVYTHNDSHHNHNHGHSNNMDDYGDDGQLIAERKSFWNIQCHCHFSCIPDELLVVSVMTYLDPLELLNISRVCRRWRFVAADSYLYRNINLAAARKLYGMSVGNRAVNLLNSRYGTGVKSWKLCNIKSLMSSTLTLVTESARSLETAHLCNLPNVSDEVVVALVKNAKNLKHLSLFGCSSISDAAVISVGENSKCLNELSLRNCVRVSNNGVAALHSPLESLNLSGCRLVDTEGIKRLAENAPTLKRLNLHGCSISDEAVDALSRWCRELVTVHLSSSNPYQGSNISDASILSLASCKELECLNLQG